MRKDSLAVLLVGFTIGFGGVYAWTKQRAPAIVRAIPQMPVATPSASSATPPSMPPPSINSERLERLREAITKNPKDFDALVELGAINFQQKNMEFAIGFFEKALEVRPTDIDLRINLGAAMFYGRRFDDSIEQFNRALEMDANNPQALFNLGLVTLHGKNNPKGALQTWEKLVETNPTYEHVDIVKREIVQLKEQLKN